MSPPYMESSFSHGNGVKTYGLSVRIGKRSPNGYSDWGCISETAFIPLVVHDPDTEGQFGYFTFGDNHNHFGLLRDISEAVEVLLKLIGEVTFMSVLRVDVDRWTDERGKDMVSCKWNYECIYGRDFEKGEYSEDDIIPLRYDSCGRIGEPRCGEHIGYV